MDNLERHKKNDKVKWIITFTALILIAISILGIALNLFIKDKKKDDSKNIDSVVESNIVLTSGQVMVHNADSINTYISQFITATIMPDTVLDKYVSWSLAWENSDCPLGEISDFLQITDDSQGNLTATINCYKPFKGYKAILSCTTRLGGLTATADVVYEGIPSSLSIDFSNESYVSEYDIGKEKVSLLYVDRPDTNKYYHSNVTFNNLFGSVDMPFSNLTDLKANLKVTLKGVGSIKTCTYYTESRGWFVRDVKEESLQSLIDKNIKPFVNIQRGIGDGCFVEIMPLLSLENYFESEDLDGGIYDDGYGYETKTTGKFYEYVLDSNGNKPYFILNISCDKYNISRDFKFYIGDYTDNVSLSETEIKF